MYMSLEACCCSSNLRFNLYCLMRSGFFRFLTASMSVSAILVTRCACATADCFCLYLCSSTPTSNRYVTRVAVYVPGVTSMLHELRDLAKVIRKSSAKTYTCQNRRENWAFTTLHNGLLRFLCWHVKKMTALFRVQDEQKLLSHRRQAHLKLQNYDWV
jgi:hypothetical protein